MCAKDHEVIRCDQSFNQIRCSLTRLYVSVVRCQVQLSVYNVLVLVPWNDLFYLEFVFFQKQTSKIDTSKKMTSPTVPLPGDIAMANVKVQCAQWCGPKWSTRVLLAGFVCREVLNKYYETIWNRILGNSSKMFAFFVCLMQVCFWLWWCRLTSTKFLFEESAFCASSRTSTACCWTSKTVAYTAWRPWGWSGLRAHFSKHLHFSGRSSMACLTRS